MDVPPGKHELTFEFDLGLVSQATAYQGVDGRPGPAKRWTTPRVTWTCVVPVPIEVVGPNESVITRVTDQALNPSAGLKVTAASRDAADRTQIRLNITYPPAATAIASKLVICVAGRDHPGPDVTFSGKVSAGTLTTTVTVPLVPPVVKTFDLVLRPSVEAAERHPDMDRIWGNEIVIRDIPLGRPDDDEPAN